MDIDALKDLIEYEPDTGIFRWKKSRAGHAKAGAEAGSVNAHGYINIQISGKDYRAHRLAYLISGFNIDGIQVDHINGIKTDNRLCNLRAADRFQNHQNMKLSKANTSGTKGVVFNKASGKWIVQIRAFGKRHIIGYFDHKDEAAAAASKAREELHGEYARHR